MIDETNIASTAIIDCIDQPTKIACEEDGTITFSELNNKRKTFPIILYEMLQDQHNRETRAEIISWLPDGKGFKIHNRIDFEQDLLWKNFKGIKFRSFQRQLNIYGFERFEEYKSPTYKHNFFVRDQGHLIKNVKRVPIKKVHVSTVTSIL